MIEIDNYPILLKGMIVSPLGLPRLIHILVTDDQEHVRASWPGRIIKVNQQQLASMGYSADQHTIGIERKWSGGNGDWKVVGVDTDILELQGQIEEYGCACFSVRKNSCRALVHYGDRDYEAYVSHLKAEPKELEAETSWCNTCGTTAIRNDIGEWECCCCPECGCPINHQGHVSNCNIGFPDRDRDDISF